MAELLGIILGPPIIYAGWVFFDDPQTGFRIYHWPLVSREEDGLTEGGESAFRVRGAFVVALGLVILLIGVFG